MKGLWWNFWRGAVKDGEVIAFSSNKVLKSHDSMTSAGAIVYCMRLVSLFYMFVCDYLGKWKRSIL